MKRQMTTSIAIALLFVLGVGAVSNAYANPQQDSVIIHGDKCPDDRKGDPDDPC